MTKMSVEDEAWTAAELMKVEEFVREHGLVTLKKEDVDRLVAAAEAAKSALVVPENGVHYCRSCHAGTTNGWEHATYCRIHNSTNDILAAREGLNAALAPFRKGE